MSSNSDQNYVVINFPGVIKNLDNALHALGGTQKMYETFLNSRPIELRAHPDNPYSIGLRAEQKHDDKVALESHYFVLRVRRKKSNPSQVEAIPLGPVQIMYTFETMCDFQYIPAKAKKGTDNVVENLVSRVVPQSLGDALTWWKRPETADNAVPLFLPPYEFSRYHTPSQKILSREPDFSAEKTKRKSGHGQNLRIERRALSISVHANDPFPEEPPDEATADAELRCKNVEPHRLLTELFKERPMWTRMACIFKTGIDDSTLKILLQKFAFYISSGPWGRLWCKFGYDPRLDPNAKKYQTIVVSFRQHALIPERQRLRVATERNNPLQQNDVDDPVHYAYIPGRLPRVRQMWYSLIDIGLSEAERMLASEPTPICSIEGSGWFTAEALDRMRRLIKDDVDQTTSSIDIEQEENALFENEEWA